MVYDAYDEWIGQSYIKMQGGMQKFNRGIKKVIIYEINIKKKTIQKEQLYKKHKSLYLKQDIIKIWKTCKTFMVNRLPFL